MPDARLDFAVVEKPLGAWTRFWNIGAVRKTFLLLVLAGLWEGYARWLNNPLLFPTFVDTVKAFFSAIASGELPKAASYTIQLLLKGYVAGLAIAALLTAFASVTRIGADLLETLTSMFNPLPSIALLPLALIWFGLGDGSIIFVSDPRGSMGSGSQYVCGFSRREPDAANGGTKLWPLAGGICRSHSDSRRVSQHPYRSQSRLGFRLAHADCGRTGVWRQLRFRRPGMVHFRAEEPAP